MASRVYTAAECAGMLAMSVDHFYRTFPALRADGMPASTTPGRYRPERTGFEAWLTRHHPQAPPVASNNNTALDLDVSAQLRREYGRAE